MGRHTVKAMTDYTETISNMSVVALAEKDTGQVRMFDNLPLEERTIRLGCIAILEWLRAQAVGMRVRPTKLDNRSSKDKACAALIEASSVLQELFLVVDGHLTFEQTLPPEKIHEMLRFAQATYRPRLMT
jgi:hypothetical protein